MSFPTGDPVIVSGGVLNMPPPVAREGRWKIVGAAIFERDDGSLVVIGDTPRSFRYEGSFTWVGLSDTQAQRLQDYYETGVQMTIQLFGTVFQMPTVIIRELKEVPLVSGKIETTIRIEQALASVSAYLI